MASLIPGYEYDIFISYRQKDNKHDGWVTEFVENLKGELESMFKDEVSVYFDINPSDYLLESYDVDASLKDKLKCLIFIPIISRTYCDPKSFAWDNELKVFINEASRDKFGFKIKLPNGNVANRVLPIRIHDLDIADLKLFESVVGGVLRSIDFVYKETGVNRQLRAKDDDIIKSQGQILYRDQINKVALTIKDIIDSMKSSATPMKKGEKKIQKRRKIEKKENLPEEAALVEKSEILETLQADKLKLEKEKSSVSLIVKTKILVPGILIFLSFLAILVVLLSHQAKIKWAKEKALPEIHKLTSAGKYIEAFALAEQAEKVIPNDLELKNAWSQFSNRVNTRSFPSDAKVYRQRYDDSDSSWVYVGTTPFDSLKYPWSFCRIKIEKKGFQTVYDATNSVQLNVRDYILDSIGKLPENMTHIPGVKISVSNPLFKNVESTEIKEFLVDKYEVTNKQYKAFVDSGGYQNIRFWKFPFILNGKVVNWDKAMSLFVDKTGRHGPATWLAGEYSKGEDNYPVCGVSWYEAAAFAEFAGKSLPTYYHWRRAASLDYRSYLPRLVLAGDGVWGISFEILRSNFNSNAPSPVGSRKGMSGYGTYDMAGNVREWCFNETSMGNQRYILGGGWNDPTYFANEDYFQQPFDRFQTNGFRCAMYLHVDEKLSILQSPIETFTPRDFIHEKPCSDQQLEIYKRMYAYDKHDLHPIIESEDKSDESWTKQRISFNSPYGERIIAYLFLPRNFKPPYQTVIYYPGSSALLMLSSKSLMGMLNIDYIITSGRAVIYPIYKGTYERRYKESSDNESDITYREHVIQWYKDLSSSLDYLKSRHDIDTSRIAYFGFSWGGSIGPIMCALEPRIKVAVLYVAGLSNYKAYPEVDPYNYVRKVKIPTLMLNGRYDADFIYETSQKPLFELLGTSPDKKRQYVYETGHFVPHNELIKETLDWLDKYLGPVK
jgi:eukaryotic-like serine/threonine-protein kinase